MPIKIKSWTQRTPAEIEAKAMKMASFHPSARALRLHKRTNLVTWLLEGYGAGRIIEQPITVREAIRRMKK